MSLKIGVVCAQFNRPVTEKLQAGAVEKLIELGVTEPNIHQVLVPGALELPLAAKALLQAGCDGVVALGAVIRGETSHYDLVCAGAERGCSELQLEFMKPIGFGVITTENAQQALARAGGDKGNKGAEAAQVTVEMIGQIEMIDKIREIL